MTTPPPPATTRAATTDTSHPALTARVDAAIAAALDEERVVGTSVLVAVDGEVAVERHAGHADREAGRPVTPDSVFRLASMSKPIVSAAALVLVGRGALGLDTVVGEVLPWFRPGLAGGGRPDITLRQLLNHTAGLDYGFLQPPDGRYARAGVSDGLDATRTDLTTNLRRVATVPLAFPPGTDWAYSIATDVVLAVVAEVTGDDPATAVADLVTGPLGMTDTRFVADPGRLTAAYARDGDDPVRRMRETDSVDFPGAGPIRFRPGRASDPGVHPSGGIGMSGTARDYLRFVEAVRTGTDPGLPETVAEALRTDSVPDLAVRVAPGLGWSLGFAVLRDPGPTGSPRPAGGFGWGGVHGTHCFADPESGTSAVALTNTALEGMLGRFPADLEHAVHTDRTETP